MPPLKRIAMKRRGSPSEMKTSSQRDIPSRLRTAIEKAKGMVVCLSASVQSLIRDRTVSPVNAKLLQVHFEGDSNVRRLLRRQFNLQCVAVLLPFEFPSVTEQFNSANPAGV